MPGHIKFVLLAVCVLLVVSTWGQLPARAMEMPVKYITPEENVSFSAEGFRRPGSFWVVYSDMQGNETYENPTGKKVKKTVGFMDAFYVAEENEQRVHIIKDSKYRDGFSPSADDFGWIDKSNLMLWDHCLITKKGKIDKKAMVLNTFNSPIHDICYKVTQDNYKDIINKAQQEGPEYFYNSNLTLKSNNSSRFDDILYIYKIKGNAILLGKNYVTDVFHANAEILGWIDARKISIWDHRIALEPNWDTQAVDEQKRLGIEPTFVVDRSRAMRFSNGYVIKGNYIVWSSPSTTKRRIGEWRRFPLLEYDENSQILKAGVLSEKGLLYYPAYSSMKVKGLNEDLYKQVLFMSQRELGDMLSKYDALLDAYNASSQRTKLKEVWLELLQNHLGDDYSREDAENMTFEQINEMLFGLSGTSDLLNFRLKDITDPAMLSDAEFYTYIHYIKNKRIELDKIFNDNDYAYGFYSYDTHYFWISQNLLP